MKTYDKKDVLCILNAERAKQYINKQGYFGNFLCPDLDDHDRRWHFGTLRGLNEHAYIADYFRAHVDEDEDYLCSFGLFLPADKVKEVEE